ncbi:STAS domain-containing protein [Streptomyces sp. NPDC006284]|uniref:STAS domain-containing protein n=1 Tax=Streptomyces sp. NPDC006284 TaxID=3156742 RepID=UPI0033BC2242
MSIDEAGAEAATHGRAVDADGERGMPAVPTGVRVPGRAAVVQYEWHDAWVVVANGSYDMHSITPLAEAMEVAAAKHEKVVVDASGIAFADSTLLNLLIHTHLATDLRVAAPTTQLQRILELTGVDTILKVRGTVEEAAVG